jgi:hypothetical protein
VEFNPSVLGEWVAGAAGDNGVISVSDRVVIGPSAGAMKPSWFSAHDVICQFYTPTAPPTIQLVNVRTSAHQTLWPTGGNYVQGGIGHWFTRAHPSGEVVLDGMVIPDPRLWPLAFGASGEIAWKAYNSGGLFFHGVWLEPPSTLVGDDDVQVVGEGCLWLANGEVCTYNLPGFPIAVTPPPGTFGWVRTCRDHAGVWWLVYQDYALGSVIVKPAHEREGYRMPAIRAWSVCCQMQMSALRVGWSVSPAEQPHDIVIWDVDLSLPRELVVGIPPQPEPPDPEPEPPTPEPEPEPEPLPPTPQPPEEPMPTIAYDPTVLKSFIAGTPEPHPDGAPYIAIRKPNGKFESIDYDGNRHERDEAGADERFIEQSGSLVAPRDFGPLRVYGFLSLGKW